MSIQYVLPDKIADRKTGPLNLARIGGPSLF